MHEKFASLATKLITKNGRDMDLVSMTNSGDAWNPTQAITTQTVKGVQSKFTSNEIDGELITSFDKLFLVYAQIEPTNTMRLRDGGIDYEVKNVQAVKPGETSVVYKIQARL